MSRLALEMALVTRIPLSEWLEAPVDVLTAAVEIWNEWNPPEE